MQSRKRAFRPKGTPKTGGRVKGTPNKVSFEVKNFCRRLVEDPIYQAGFIGRLHGGTLPPGLEAMVWNYAFGKPTEQLEVSGTVNTVKRVVFELHRVA
jgi:hypothetical protein